MFIIFIIITMDKNLFVFDMTCVINTYIILFIVYNTYTVHIKWYQQDFYFYVYHNFIKVPEIL